MIKAESLSYESIINALKKGDFYASCGPEIYDLYIEDNKVESVRKMIELVYKVNNETFIMPDADTMSVAAKNALLKVIEECPNNNYFIMTLEDENNTLETIRSRGTIFYMDKYTLGEIHEYANQYMEHDLQDEEWDIIKNICDTPGDVNILGKSPQAFYDYVQLVVDNMASVSLTNAFKIPSKVALKDGAEGYDLRLFWKTFQKVCGDRILNNNNVLAYFNWIMITSRYLQQLRIKGINKQMLVDNWILEIRRV